MCCTRRLRHGLDHSEDAWRVGRSLLTFLESNWDEPDEGIWEVRGGRRHFTHSRMMAWVAFDRGAKIAERLGLDGPLDRWRAIRDEIHAQVCRDGFRRAISARSSSPTAPGGSTPACL